MERHAVAPALFRCHSPIPISAAARTRPRTIQTHGVLLDEDAAVVAVVGAVVVGAVVLVGSVAVVVASRVVTAVTTVVEDSVTSRSWSPSRSR